MTVRRCSARPRRSMKERRHFRCSLMVEVAAVWPGIVWEGGRGALLEWRRMTTDYDRRRRHNRRGASLQCCAASAARLVTRRGARDVAQGSGDGVLKSAQESAGGGAKSEVVARLVPRIAGAYFCRSVAPMRRMQGWSGAAGDAVWRPSPAPPARRCAAQRCSSMCLLLLLQPSSWQTCVDDSGET